MRTTITFLLLSALFFPLLTHAQWIGGSTTGTTYRTGKVGLGLSSPSELLDINGSTVVRQKLYVTRGNGTDDAVELDFGYPYSGVGWPEQHERALIIKSKGWMDNDGAGGGGFQFITRDWSRSSRVRVERNALTIRRNGRVGIGTTDPKATLAVNGDIRAKEIRVMTNIQLADYVFDEDYSLRPLAEVASYVQEHKHLPGVPSAAEVKENGMDVAEFQNKLLEKVEELTLYIIEQNKELESIKKENSLLKQQFDSMQADKQ
ncbi:hypothetical protein [Tunicatimonas pelagia]|uniref:hypothetical protein n=1 Tax=Tunicatimonas pelagia TaxID=931531 RepID=UPI002665A3B3|nr:hypothetical protein [Tunicatimonas pelagia]WKN40701.1 hypothetical protein P0M28_16810 [Tunicatimonas pelagia]